MEAKIDIIEITSLINNFKSTYSGKGYVSAKQVSPNDVIMSSNIPIYGKVGKNITNWLIKGNYLKRTGHAHTIAYQWNASTNGINISNLAADYMRFLKTPEKKKKAVKVDKCVKSTIDLGQKVLIIYDNDVMECIVKSIIIRPEGRTYVVDLFDELIEVEEDKVYTSIKKLCEDLTNKFKENFG